MLRIWYHREPGNVDDYREFRDIKELDEWILNNRYLGIKISVIKGQAKRNGEWKDVSRETLLMSLNLYRSHCSMVRKLEEVTKAYKDADNAYEQYKKQLIKNAQTLEES